MRAKPKQKVFVFSLDFDGCIAPAYGSRDLRIGKLLDMMAEKLRADPDAVLIFLDGSYRQSIELDQYNFNQNQNGSCFQGFEKLLDLFLQKFPDLKNRVLLDRFILEDIPTNQKDGYWFNLATEFLNRNGEVYYLRAKSNTGSDLSRWHDPEKRAQVYAQIQHVASRFPEADIFFEQIDDLYEKILVPCNQFYSENSFLIPKNVTYSQSQWVHGELQSKTTNKINGEGLIDFDYRENTLQIKSAAFDKWVFIKTIEQHLKLKLGMPNALSHPKHELRFFLLLIEIRGWSHVEKIFDETQDISKKSRYQLALLEIAIEQNNKDMIQKFLTPDFTIRSASRVRCWNIVAWLVNQNPTEKSHHAYALYQAIYHKQISLAEKLISQMTPEMRIAHTEGNNRTVLDHAVLQQNYGLLEKLLSDASEPNEKFEGACENAFNFAKIRGDKKAMELLSPHFIHDEVYEPGLAM